MTFTFPFVTIFLVKKNVFRPFNFWSQFCPEIKMYDFSEVNVLLFCIC